MCQESRGDSRLIPALWRNTRDAAVVICAGAGFPHVTMVTVPLTRTEDHEADRPLCSQQGKIMRLDLEKNHRVLKAMRVSCFHRWVSFKELCPVTRQRNFFFFKFKKEKRVLKLINNHQAPGAGDFEQALHEAMGGRYVLKDVFCAGVTLLSNHYAPRRK